MIFSVLIFIASGILSLFHIIFNALSFLIPDQIENAIVWAFGYVNIFRGVLPVATLMLCMSYILYAWGAKYAIQLFFRFIAPYIPYFNKHQIQPFAKGRAHNQPTK